MKQSHLWFFPAIALAVMSFQSQPCIAAYAYDVPQAPLIKGQDLSITLRGSAGLLNGKAGELVYDFNSGSRRKASELIWDLRQIVMLGGVASVNICSWADLNLGVWAAATGGNGGMIDYDWFPNTPGATSPEDWTDRSFSDVDVTSATMFDINAAIKLFTWEEITFKGIIGFKQDKWKWTDSGQGYVYSIYSFRDTIGSFEGRNVINYDQTFSIPYVGGSAAVQSGPFDIGAYMLISLGVSAEDHDFHILRGLHFTERFSGGTYVALGGTATYHVTKELFISGALEYQSIPEIAGDMEFTEPGGQTYSNPGAAGISHSSTMISLSVGYLF